MVGGLGEVPVLKGGREIGCRAGNWVSVSLSAFKRGSPGAKLDESLGVTKWDAQPESVQ